uniref:Uncharacterized protein n=1 Tax=Globisporangium ultimum (strain ATCC 200006 / CBS 805.95 / DAOM BR144) TaxID=431595 RepID=K3X9S8_GLOUD
MLPSTLKPTFIVPEKATQHSQILTALKKVESVEVKSSTGYDGERVYVVEAHEYSSSTSRILTAAETLPEHNRVAARVERVYSSFDDFRTNVYFSARNAHYLELCDFCQNVCDEVGSGRNKPGSVLKLLGSDRKTTQTLTKFLNVMLEIAKCAAETNGCRGENKVCFLVHEFLFKQ